MPDSNQVAKPSGTMERHGTELSDARRKIRALFHLVGGKVSEKRRQSRRLEIVALVLSVLTSGAIWTLIADKAADLATWAGAVAGTLTTFVLVYQKTLGPQKDYEELVVILGATQELLVQLETVTESGGTNPNPPNDYAEKYRDLQSRLMTFGLVEETRNVSETTGSSRHRLRA